VAAPTLPTLNWERSAVVSVSTATTSEMLSAIYTCISSSNYWTVASYSTGATAAVDYVEVRPRLTGDTAPATASAQPAMQAQRFIVAGRGSGNLTSTSMGNATTSTSRVGVPGTDTLVMNYAPEGNSGSSVTVDLMFPYGNRATGYYGVCDDIDGSNNWNVWIIESAEILTVCLENMSDNKSMYGFCAGALMRPPTTGSNDIDVDNRLYGSICHGQECAYTWTTSYTQGWSDSSTTQVNNYKAVVFDPTSGGPGPFDETGYTTGSTCQLIGVYRFADMILDTAKLVTADGAFIGLPMNFWSDVTKASGSLSPSKFIGTMRQVRYIRDFPSRVIIQDGSGTTVGFAWGSHPTTMYDSVGFTNS